MFELFFFVWEYKWELYFAYMLILSAIHYSEVRWCAAWSKFSSCCQTESVSFICVQYTFLDTEEHFALSALFYPAACIIITLSYQFKNKKICRL